MVYRAKGMVKDMEFVQFHPTSLYNPNETHPAYLITEAMRGYGGILRLPNGEEFIGKGISPHIYVERTLKDVLMSDTNDSQLSEAIKYLKKI